MKTKIKQIAIASLSTLVLSTCMVQFGKGVLRDARYERLRREVQIVADIDKDKVITHDEWRPVYENLGVEYRNEYGLDLSTEQFERYLEIR
jgi:hypothetical protein